MISVEQAFELIAQYVGPLACERVSLMNAVGRSLASDIVADVDSPPHDKSVMDGYAVRAADVSRGARLRVLETVVAGTTPTQKVQAGTATRIMTGAPMPTGANSVVMVEQTRSFDEEDKTWVEVDAEELAAGKHTMPRAASFAAGQTIFTAPHIVRPADIGLLAEIGAATIQVHRQASAAVLPTGDELVDVADKPGPGQIRNSNGPMLESLLAQAGLKTDHLGVGRDDVVELRQKIADGLQHDLLVISGGVSAGMLDLVPRMLEEAGVQQVFHKVKVKPGKPIWFGVRDNGDHRTHVFGLPGNPVSSLVGVQLFVRGAIARFNGFSRIHPLTVVSELGTAHEARGDRPTWWPGKWINDDRPTRLVEPLSWQGSSDLKPLSRADCLIHFPADRQHYAAGHQVDVLDMV